MRIPVMLTGLALSLASAVFGADAPADPNAAALTELQTLRKDVADMKSDLTTLRKDMVELKTSLENRPARRADPYGADIESLQKITLPDNATEEQARKYISDIVLATVGQQSYSDRDPQIAMYAELGPERVKLLVDALTTNSASNWHLQRAIIRLATDAHKKVIIDALAGNRELVQIIVEKGWEQDARDVLLKGLTNRTEYLPPDWIRAVVRLNDPKTYDALKAYLVKGQNREQTYNAIVDLPEIDLKDAVRQAWANVQRQRGNDWEMRRVAMFAIDYGNTEALEYLIDWITDEHPNDTYEVTQMRSAVLRHVPVRGTNKDIAEWYNKNKDALVFDDATKKFAVREKAKPE